MEATKQSTIGDSSLKGNAIRDAASSTNTVTATDTATTTNNNKQLKYSPTCFSIEQLKQMTVTFAPSSKNDTSEKAIQLQETFYQNGGRIEFMIRDLHSKKLRPATNDDLKYRSLKDIEICISYPPKEQPRSTNSASTTIKKTKKKKSEMDTMTEHKTTSTMAKKKKKKKKECTPHDPQQTSTKNKTKTNKKTPSSSSKMAYDNDKKQQINSAAKISEDKRNEITSLKKKKKKLRITHQMTSTTTLFAVGDSADVKPNAATKNITFATTESRSVTSIKRKRFANDNYDDNDNNDDDDDDEDYYEKESFKNKKCRRTSTSPKILRTNSSGSASSSGTVEVFSGIATEPELEGLGWIKKEFLRLNGATRGTRDKYWYTPVLNKKIRSMAQVREFLNCLDLSNMDEEEAWKLLQQSKTIKNTPIQGDVF